MESPGPIGEKVVQVSQVFDQDNAAAWLKRSVQLAKKSQFCFTPAQFVRDEDEEDRVAFAIFERQVCGIGFLGREAGLCMAASAFD